MTIAILFAVIGAYITSITFGASSTAPLESEKGRLSGLAIACSQDTASAKSYVFFGTNNCNGINLKYINPVKVQAADPAVIKVDNRYYMVWTSGTPYFYIFTSTDLVNWEWTFANVFSGTHPWGQDRFWAPEIHRVGNKFVAYYSAAKKTDGKLAVGAAVANSITGPYTDIGRPLVEDTFGVIDVNFFAAPNGNNYLYWKEDSGSTRIFGQQVDASGINFVGQRKVVLQKGLAWEGTKGIEAPWVTFKNNQYYMFYSGELYSSDKYAIGVARSLDPLGVFTKKGDPIVKSSAVWKGPGHNSFIDTGNDEFIVYHAYKFVAGQGERDTIIDKVTWLNNWPGIAGGIPSDTAQPYPR
jgi:arabinan endo-1,5-alpha-L-arabinosidase